MPCEGTYPSNSQRRGVSRRALVRSIQVCIQNDLDGNFQLPTHLDSTPSPPTQYNLFVKTLSCFSSKLRIALPRGGSPAHQRPCLTIPKR